MMAKVNKEIDKIKQTNEQTIQNDTYIKRLQNEVKVKDYELKLLKEKEDDQRDELRQMNRFFSDGVPLNNNVLALKTQYQ